MSSRLRAAGCAAALVCSVLARPAQGVAQSTPSPGPSSAPSPAPAIGAPAAASPSPSPSVAATETPTPGFATPKPLFGSSRFTYTAEGSVTEIGQQYAGPGISPAEGPGFAAGSAIAPGTPYDFFSSAPTVAGNGVQGALVVNLAYAASSKLDFSVRAGYGGIAGSGNTAAYWGEQLLPTLDPHLGSQAVGLNPAFPTHAGEDDVGNQRLSILSASVGTHDGRTTLRVGYFDPVQSDRFVFTQPAITQALPALAPQIAESLGDGPPALDDFPQRGTALPLDGVDLSLVRGDASYEALTAELPAPPGTPVRMSMASAVIDHHNGTRLSAQVLHAWSGGDPVVSTTFFGLPPGGIVPSSQGPLPQTTVAGQRETIAGMRGAFSIDSASDAVVEIGRSFYDTSDVASTVTSGSGGFYHLGYHRTFGALDGDLDGYRFEPRYATMFLPYGTLENVWSVAYSWPGAWLKGTYQLADNTVVGVNREGARARVSTTLGRLSVRASYAAYTMIDPLNLANGMQASFVEGYYLPQITAAGATLGHQKQYALWLDYKLPAVETTLDLADDTQHRDATSSNPGEAVSIEYPEATLTFSRPITKRFLVAAGLARYGLYGSFSSSVPNAYLAQRITFGGFEYAFGRGDVLHVQYRAYANSGLPTATGAPPSDYHGDQVLVEERFRL